MSMMVQSGRFGVAGGGGPTSTQWRLNITARYTSANWTSIKDMEFRSTIGGSNIATGGTASASHNNSGANPASNAFDGNAATQWQTGTATLPNWIQYTFATAVTVEQVSITQFALGDNPITFDVQYWDGSFWVTYWSVFGTGWNSGTTRVFTNGTKVLWRLNVVQTVNTSNFIAVREIEFHSTHGGADLTSAAPSDGAGAHASLNVGAAYQAFDNGTNNWDPGAGTKPSWVGWMFAATQNITEIAITGPASTGDAPSSITVDYWSGSAWVNVYTNTTVGSWTAGQVKTFNW